MVWACMTSDGPGRIHIGNKRINSEIYQEILEYNTIVEIAVDLCGKKIFINMIPLHTSESTMNWINQNQINVFPWATNSPDINPFANSLEVMMIKQQYIAPKKQS